MAHSKVISNQRSYRTPKPLGIWYSNLIIVPPGVGLTDFLSQYPVSTITLNLNGLGRNPNLCNDIVSDNSLQITAPYLLLIP
jgi:hypothetical protein